MKNTEMISSNIQITEADMNRRVDEAVALFKQGYNCSQSVVAAFADLYGFTAEQAFRMAASFGGGIGRMRQTCGAACGLFQLVGLDCGAVDGADREGKSHNYAVVQQLAADFERINGSLICAELLGLKTKETSPQAEPRTEKYYQKRPCVEMVRTAAQLFAKYLLSNANPQA